MRMRALLLEFHPQTLQGEALERGLVVFLRRKALVQRRRLRSGIRLVMAHRQVHPQQVLA